MSADTGLPPGTQALQSAAVAQAADWFTRHRYGRLSGAEKQMFIEWLRASPVHVNEYLAAARVAEDLAHVAAHLRANNPALLHPHSASSESNVVRFQMPLTAMPVHATARLASRLKWMAAAVLVLALGGASFWTFSAPGLNGLPRSVSAIHGEQRTVRLRDGSIAHLNTDSRIRVKYSRGERLIEFERGQALFQVARDATRPFRVRTNGTEVLAVGTQFELYRKAAGEVMVTVVEGLVDVKPEPALPGDPVRSVRLGAGESVRIAAAARSAPQPVRVDVRTATAWVHHELIFREQNLSSVAGEFSRYNAVPIVIDDPSLRELQISGVFKAYDVESFMGFLRQFEGVEVQRELDVIHVRRRAESVR